MRRWVDAYPQRLAYELAEFERRGLNFALDEAYLARSGLVVLAGTVLYGEQEIELLVAYPDSFPFMRPEVFAPTLELDRHQNPIERNLCLLERSSRAWSVSDTGAWLVAERVPYLLGLLDAGGDDLLAAEAPQGEPASVYFGGESGAVVFIPEEMLAISPENRVGLLQLATGVNDPPQKLLRACLSRVSVRTHGKKKQTLAEFGKPLSERFAGTTLDGRWVRLARLPTGNRPRELLAAIAEVEPAFGKPRWQPLGAGDISVVGAVVPEEVAQGEWQDTWLFVVAVRDSPSSPEGIYIARGERLSAPDLQARLPSSSRLDQAKIGVVGLGSLGAPLAAEFLRAQVGELRTIDFDRVEAGNTVRWSHGLSAVGYLKSDVIAGWAATEYPFTRVKAYNHRIGGVAPPFEDAQVAASESDGLGEFLNGLDLVIDVTGELGVQHLVATLAQEFDLPQMFAWGTEGGWGGAVACVSPGLGGCWMCLQLAFEDGTIELPPAASEPPLQPRGCADPTFAAPGYALSPIVAQAARATARIVNDGGSSEVHVCALQDPDGELPAPRWLSTPIPIHECCPCGHRALTV